MGENSYILSTGQKTEVAIHIATISILMPQPDTLERRISTRKSRTGLCHAGTNQLAEWTFTTARNTTDSPNSISDSYLENPSHRAHPFKLPQNCGITTRNRQFRNIDY